MDLYKTKKALWSYQKCVSFDEPSHTYYYKNRTMTSVTTAVGNCFPRFDRGGNISIALAEKRGITVKQLKKEWKDKAALGTEVHEALESIVWGRVDVYLPGSWVSDRVLQGQDFIISLLNGSNCLLFPEFAVYDGEFSVAGTCDLLVFNCLTGKIDIYDWKTNDTIMSPFVGFNKYGFGRISHLLDTNFWHYALQLSIYKYILEKHGFAVGDLHLVHLADSRYEVIKLPYLSDEALVVLEDNL